MTVPQNDPAFLWDMLQAARVIESSLAGASRDQLLNDQILQSVIERQFEILGEAARGVSTTTRDEHPDIPWRNIIGLRNVISHQYRRVDHSILWSIAQDDLPILIPVLEAIVPPPPEES